MALVDINSCSKQTQLTNLLATAVLLNGTLTLATLLRIGLDPVGRLTIILTFLQPQPGGGTDYGAMIVIDVATKAELVRGRRATGDDRDNGRESGLRRCGGTGDGVGAGWVGAILQVPVRCNVVTYEQLLEAIPDDRIACQNALDELVRSG